MIGISMSGKRGYNAASGSDRTVAFITELNENDVLMGRGSPSTEYSGNLRFRQLVRERRAEYLKAVRRRDKHQIAESIIETVHKRGGRFLQRITTLEDAEKLRVPPKTQAWRVIPTSSALFIKVKQLMRDVAPEANRNGRCGANNPKCRREGIREASPVWITVNPPHSFRRPSVQNLSMKPRINTAQAYLARLLQRCL